MGTRTTNACLAGLQDDREVHARGEQVTASDFAGWQEVASSHGEGSMRTQRLAEHAYPRDVEFVDELFGRSSGKIRRIELRERERDGR